MNLIIFSTILKWLTPNNITRVSSWVFISSVFGTTFSTIVLLGFSTRLVESAVRFHEVGIVVWTSSLGEEVVCLIFSCSFSLEGLFV